jgi:hypothetical protein
MSFKNLLTIVVLCFVACKNNQQKQEQTTIDDSTSDEKNINDTINDTTATLQEATVETKNVTDQKAPDTIGLSAKNTPVKGQNEPISPSKLAKPKENTIRGYFIYFADAKVFYPCDQQNTPYPVVNNGKITLELERAYLKQVEGGTKCYIELEGEYLIAQSGEEGSKKRSVKISKVLTLDKNTKCK